MLAPLLINLAVASVAVYFTLNTQEEIVRVAATFAALLGSFLSLFFAPPLLKLLILTLPFLWDKFRRDGSLQEDLER